MARYRFDNHVPRVPETAYVADTATLIGHVVLGDHASVWPGAVIRADTDPIFVGDGTNIQDNAVLHVDPGVPLTLGERITVGHQAMLHGCTVGVGSLIGIQAIVLNRATIGRECLVAAGALVTEGKVFPDRSLIMGAPAKLVRPLNDEELLVLQASAETYIRKAAQYKAGLVRLD